jgi:hypothetical protein
MNNEVTTINLDLHAAQTAQHIIDAAMEVGKGKAQETETLVTKALGVLQENGVYACALFLYARTMDRAIAEKVRDGLLRMTSELGLSPPPKPDWKVGLKFVTDQICSDLDRLLLVRQLWEQTLIYTRYEAKAWGVAKDKKESGEQP